MLFFCWSFKPDVGRNRWPGQQCLLVPVRIAHFPLKTKGKGKKLTYVLVPGTPQNIITVLFPLPQVTAAIIEHRECWPAVLFFSSSALSCVWLPRRLSLVDLRMETGFFCFSWKCADWLFLFGHTKVKLLTLLNKCWEDQLGLQEAPTSSKTSGLILGHALRKARTAFLEASRP